MKPLTTLSLKNIFVIGLLAIAAVPAIAQENSSCIKALPELRAARWMIDHGQDTSKTEDDITAMHEIELTVAELISDDIDDGHYFNERPDLPNLDQDNKSARIYRAGQLLQEARLNISNDNDRSIAQLKPKMLKHIDTALGILEKAVADK